MALLTLPRVIVRKTTSNAHKLGCQSRFYLSCILIIFVVAATIPDVCGKGIVKKKCSNDGKTCYSVIRLNTNESITREMMNTTKLLFNKYTESNKTTIDEDGLSQLLKDLGLIQTKLPDDHGHDEHHKHDDEEHDDHDESLEESDLDHLSDNLLGEDHGSDNHVEEDHGHDHSLHDHGHDHTRKRREVEEEHEEDHHEGEECEFIERIEKKYGKGSEGLHMTFDNFLTILPQLLLDKIQSKPCLVEGDDDHAEELESDTQNAAKVWLIALASVFIISILSIIGLLTVPLMKYSQFYQRFMAGLVALAVGTLVGDAILHLLPHATSEEEEGEHHGAHNHSPNVIYKHLTAVAGIYMFFLFETCMHLYRNYKQEQKSIENHKVNSNGVKRPSQEEGAEFQDSSLGVLLPTKNANGNNLEILGGGDLENGGQHIGNDLAMNAAHDSGHHHCNHDHMIKNGNNSSVLDMAWMVIAGDGLHNFSDGLAIGAAFSSTIAAGLGTSFAIFFHELPHELGDFAILIQAGMSIRQALVYNVMCACLAFAGAIIGIVIGEYASNFKMWVLAFTAGGFLYVALVSMLPDLVKTACDKSDKWKFLIVHIGLLSGIFCMLLIALYEDSFEMMF